jgi:hypothetical protein
LLQAELPLPVCLAQDGAHIGAVEQQDRRLRTAFAALAIGAAEHQVVHVVQEQRYGRMPRLQIQGSPLQPCGCEHQVGALRSQVGKAVSQGLALGQALAQVPDCAEALRPV